MSSKNGNGNRLPKKRPGRSRKLTKDFIKKAAKMVEQGSYASVACAALGVSKAIWFAWKSKGEEDLENGIKSLEVEFLDALYAAEAKCEERLVAGWTAPADGGDWRASKEFLERKHYNRWGKKEVVKHTGPDGGPLQHAHLHADLKEVMDDKGKSEILAAWSGNILGITSRPSDRDE